MIVYLLLLAQASAPAPAPTPAPTVRPVPLLGRSGPAARPKTLSEHAAEMKAKGTPARRVTFDDVPSVGAGSEAADEMAEPVDGTGPAGSPAGKPDEAAARSAQRRMDRAVERGLEVPERTRSPRRDKARTEWDDAAEACRKTPGCVPVYRDDPRWGDKKPLRTDAELIEEIRKRGFSEPHPIRK